MGISAEKLSEIKSRVGTGTIHPEGFCISNINSQDVALLIAEVERLRELLDDADANDPYPYSRHPIGGNHD